MHNNALLSQLSLKIIKILSQESGLQALVDLGYETLGNPFTLTDYSVKVLATTGESSVTDDPVWNELKTNNNFVFQTYSYYVRNSLYNEIARNETPFFWSDPYCKYPRLIGKIRVNNKDIATMVVCAHNRGFEEKDKELVALFCDAFAIELQKKNYSDFSQGLMHQSFFYDLLDGEFKDERLIAERIKILGLKFLSKLFVISIDIQNFDKSKFTLPYMRDEIENKVNNSKAIVYKQNIVVLTSCENERYFLIVGLKLLKEFIENNHLKAGISRPFSKLTDIRNYYLESVEALTLGNLIHSEDHFYKYEDFVIYDLISYCGEKSKRLVHSSLQRLIDYDNINGTDYVRSLYTYLRNFKNVKESALSLNIHRNTMFHRIEKIENILNVDLNNGDILFHLYLSYKIMDFFKITLP